MLTSVCFASCDGKGKTAVHFQTVGEIGKTRSDTKPSIKRQFIQFKHSHCLLILCRFAVITESDHVFPFLDECRAGKERCTRVS